jgi:WD40-like Beta Propeller Repeat
MDTPRHADARAQLDRDNPWPGLESYDESSYGFFSGRAAEADDLQRRICDEPLTVLFGKSGLGKTSLLKAGVFPRLREKGLLPIFLRLQFRHGAESLIDQVALVLYNELRAQGIDHPTPLAGETLWEYVHRNGQEFWTPQNRLVRPVFVFDQFEELFTLGRAVPAAVEAFREDLADLAENRIPAAVARRIADRAASDLGLDVQAMSYKIVISLREDFLADLEGWRVIMPSLRRNRMRLLPMGTEQALQAVCNERTNHLVAELLAAKIVAFLSSGAATTDGDGSRDSAGLTVEPALLSLFCRGVNEHRKQDGKACFDEALIEGGKGTIVTDFYRTSLKDQPERVRQFIEEELVTENGFRNSYSVDDALARGFVTTTGLETLVGRRLLRQEHHLGTDRVELTHDLLTKAVIEERDVRRRVERGEGERRQRRKLLRISAGLGATALLFLILFVINWKQKSANHDLAGELSEKVKKLERAEFGLKGALAKANEAEIMQWKAARAAWLEQEKAKDAARHAKQESQRANDERNRSRSKELAALVETAIDNDPHLAVALSLEGLRRADTAEARSALLNAAQYAWPLGILEQKKLGGKPDVIALNSDGTRLAVLAAGRTITMWDVTSTSPSMAWREPVYVDASSSLAFSSDKTLLAVGRKASIDLLQTTTGRIDKSLPQSEGSNRQIGFSPDGRWLASLAVGDGFIRLLDYRDPQAEEIRVPAKGVIAFSLADGGKRIIGVTDRPLSAHALDQQADGNWKSTKLDLSDCMAPDSVSPGVQYSSATWKARACDYPLTDKRLTAFSRRGDQGADNPIRDIVWSAAGGAFVEMLFTGEFIVTGQDRARTRLESRIRGVRILDHPDKSRLISVSETGTRVAFIENNPSQVKIYSLAHNKPFLSKLERLFSVAPDGTWIAVARGTTAGKPAAVIDVIPIDRSFPPDYRSEVRTSIPVIALPSRIYATQSSVVAVLPTQPVTTVVFDASTGNPRFDRQIGRAQPLGADGDLLLIQPPSEQPSRLIKTKNGSELAPWGQSSVTGRPLSFMLSARKEALAVLRVQASNPKQMDAFVYSVRGDRLVPMGQVLELPAGTRSRFEVVDDARSITEARPAQSGKPAVHLVWSVTNARAPTRAEPAPTRERPVTITSPLRRFEIQTVSGKSRGAGTFTVIRRADNFMLKVFSSDPENSRFSSDDRWLVVDDNQGIQVFDLARGQMALDLRPLDVRGFEFEARNTILKVQLPDGTTLIPLDHKLMERFAKWLAPPRKWTLSERCKYGLDEGGEDCRKAVSAPRAQSTSPSKPVKEISP